MFLGVTDYGVFRPDVGAVFGPQFTNSGFNLMAGPLAPGIYDVVVFARTLVSGTFEIYAIVASDGELRSQRSALSLQLSAFSFQRSAGELFAEN